MRILKYFTDDKLKKKEMEIKIDRQTDRQTNKENGIVVGSLMSRQ